MAPVSNITLAWGVGVEETILQYGGENTPGRANAASKGAAYFRRAYPRMITDRHFGNSQSPLRALHDHLDRPSVGGFAQPECKQRLVSCGPERTEIREMHSAHESYHVCRETVAEDGMPGHRPCHPLPCQPRTDDDIRGTLAQRL